MAHWQQTSLGCCSVMPSSVALFMLAEFWRMLHFTTRLCTACDRQVPMFGRRLACAQPVWCWNSHQANVSTFQVAAPKATTLANLQRQTKVLPVDANLLFSSVAALLGSPGQANYSAANAALDAAAQQLQQAGTVATSVQWGAWAGTGMAAGDASTASRIERTGMSLIPIASGLGALAAAFRHGFVGGGCAVLSAVPFIWPRFAAAARKPLPQVFAHYIKEEAGSVLAASSSTSTFGPGLAAVDVAAIEAAVHGAVKGILGADVGSTEPLMAAGLDSLGAVELHSSLEQKLGLQLPSTLVFDYPTVAALTEFLAAKLGPATSRGVSSVAGLPAAGMAPFRMHSTAAAPEAVSAVTVLGASCRSAVDALHMLAVASLGADAVHLVPLDRWDVEGDPLSARFGAYLSSVAAFDAAAFGTSDTEAALMDPQQRLLLETTGETLLAVPVDLNSAPMRARGIYVGASGVHAPSLQEQG